MTPDTNFQKPTDRNATAEAPSDFRRQVTFLVIGALLGMIPTIAVTVYQGTIQRRQALFDQRVSLYKDFVDVSVLPSVELADKWLELELEAHSLVADSPTNTQLSDFFQKVSQATNESRRWSARATTQLALLNAMFAYDSPGPTLSIGPVDHTLLEEPSEDSLEHLEMNARLMREAIDEMREQLLERARLLAVELRALPR